MKWLEILSLLPAASVAFQHSAAPIRTQRAVIMAAHRLPEQFARAEQCATHYGTCDVTELEELATGRSSSA